MTGAKLRGNLIVLLLAAAAFLGNYYVVELFFGVDIILGSIFWLMILRGYSAKTGVFLAILASLLTIRLWNHPYGMVVFSLEAVTIALILRWRPQTNLVAAASFFWFLLAPAIVYGTYHRVLDLNALETIMIYLKQSVNGLFNATIASLLLNHTGIIRWFGSLARQQERVSLRETLFTLTIAVILLPALTLTVSNSRARIVEMEEAAWERLSTAASVASHTVVDRYGDLQSVLVQHARYAGDSQSFVNSLAGLLSFRQYLQVEAAAFWDDDGTHMLFRFSENEAIPMNGSAAAVGAVHGWLPIEIPIHNDGSDDASVVFVDESVLLPLNLDAVLPSDLFYSFITADAAAAVDTGTLAHTIPDMGVRMRQWSHSHYLVQHPIPGTPQWYVTVEMPVRPHRDRLYEMYVVNFGIALGLILLSILVAAALSRWMVQPILVLSAISTDVDEKGRLETTTSWPSSPIRELNQLSENLAGMMQQLQTSFNEAEKARLQYEHLASHDTLTGLRNRRACGELLKEALAAAAAKTDRQRVGVLFFDLDAFKAINDTMGHQVGDQVLQAVAERLVQTLGNRGTLCRYGGDEFAVVVPATGGRRHLQRLAGRVLQAMSKPLQVGNAEFLVTVSIGISMSPKDGRDADILLKKADIAMYEAKTMGKNQAQSFEQSMLPQGAARLFLSTDLAKALKEDQLDLFYQPIMDLRSGKCIALEALVRWRHPDWGLIMPGDFIPFAEENGQIVDVGQWVLRTAAAQMVQWSEQGFSDLQVSVNVARRQLQETGFVRMVQQVLQETGLAPEQLQLEVTESTVMQNQKMVTEVLHRCMELGIATAMDDFGTGHSSLACLRQLPLATLKVDRSFISQIRPHSKDALLIRAAAALGKSLELQITAEGVEHAAQCEVLVELGCDSAQGFFFGKPMPAADVYSWLCSHKSMFIQTPR